MKIFKYILVSVVLFFLGFGIVKAGVSVTPNGCVNGCPVTPTPTPDTFCDELNYALTDGEFYGWFVDWCGSNPVVCEEIVGECGLNLCEFLPQHEDCYHLDCVEEVCVLVKGEGENLCECDEDCVIPTPTLTEAPEPTPELEHIPNIQPAGWVGRCYGYSHPVIPWASATRKGTSASIDYVPTTGEGDVVNVVFSENPFEIIFNLGSHGLRDWRPNSGHVELNDLVEGQAYYFRVANGCSWWSNMWVIPAN